MAVRKQKTETPAAAPAEPKPDRTAAKPKGESYSVYDASGKRVAGAVDREVAVRAFNETKRRDGVAPKFVRDSDGHES